MELLKVIGHLMNYPSAAIAENLGELALAISNSREISPDDRAGILEFMQALYDGELMDAEVGYTGLFEQGRSLSLHLFEHVHGESRDRGQAMVDLMEEYSRHGFVIDARELPDYIPLFLEYLSYRPDLEAREWLADMSHILALLAARLEERESPYSLLFKALLVIAGRSEAIEEHRAKVKEEVPDNTPEALDREWEEVAVTFGADDQACSTNTGLPASEKRHDIKDEVQPVRWVESANTAAMNHSATSSGGQPL